MNVLLRSRQATEKRKSNIGIFSFQFSLSTARLASDRLIAALHKPAARHAVKEL
jgi:hypothetical protein